MLKKQKCTGRKNKGYVEDLLTMFILVFFLSLSFYFLLNSTLFSGDESTDTLTKSDKATITELTKVIEAVPASSEDPKAALAMAISMSDLHEVASVPVEAAKTFKDSEVSYRISETGERLAATVNSQSGKICAITSSPVGPVGGCITEATHPESFKDPLNSIAKETKLWNDTQKN